MVESRCGIECGKCSYKEPMGCQGCVNIKKPFWGDVCPLKQCCEGKELDHCGECGDFPCETLKQMSYDKQQGDNGQRIENCKSWVTKTLRGN